MFTFIDPNVSTHDLTKRSTCSVGNVCGTSCFNSRPHGEVDPAFKLGNFAFHVSTHDLSKRSTSINAHHFLNRQFQLTTSRRGRQYLLLAYHLPYMFQLTTSRRGRRFCLIFQYLLPDVSTHDLTKRSTDSSAIHFCENFMFQLTTSRRGRLNQCEGE